MPPLWGREPGFRTLVQIILEQQVSLISAEAIFIRIEHQLGTVEPHRLLQAGEVGLRDIGVTRQKSRYLCDLAEWLQSGRLKLDELRIESADQVRGALMQVTGIGRWTADIYLLMAMRHPDIWPPGDIALANELRVVKQMTEKPDQALQNKLAADWAPWRSVAARIFWASYLHRQGRL